MRLSKGEKETDNFFRFALWRWFYLIVSSAELIWSILLRSTQEKAKKEQENRLKFVKEQLEISTREIKCLIKEITSKVEDQVIK